MASLNSDFTGWGDILKPKHLALVVVCWIASGCGSTPVVEAPIAVVPNDTSYLVNCELLGNVALPMGSTFKYPPGDPSSRFAPLLAKEALRLFPTADHVSWSGVSIVGAYPTQQYRATGTALKCYGL